MIDSSTAPAANSSAASPRRVGRGCSGAGLGGEQVDRERDAAGEDQQPIGPPIHAEHAPAEGAEDGDPSALHQIVAEEKVTHLMHEQRRDDARMLVQIHELLRGARVAPIAAQYCFRNRDYSQRFHSACDTQARRAPTPSHRVAPAPAVLREQPLPRDQPERTERRNTGLTIVISPDDEAEHWQLPRQTPPATRRREERRHADEEAVVVDRHALLDQLGDRIERRARKLRHHDRRRQSHEDRQAQQDPVGDASGVGGAQHAARPLTVNAESDDARHQPRGNVGHRRIATGGAFVVGLQRRPASI